MIVTNLQQQFWGALRRSWLRIVRAGVLAALAGAAFGEFGGLALNNGHATSFVHLTSLILCLVMGYAAALTAAVFSVVRGLFAALTDIETSLRSALGSSWQVIDSELHKQP